MAWDHFGTLNSTRNHRGLNPTAQNHSSLHNKTTSFDQDQDHDDDDDDDDDNNEERDNEKKTSSSNLFL